MHWKEICTLKEGRDGFKIWQYTGAGSRAGSYALGVEGGPENNEEGVLWLKRPGVMEITRLSCKDGKLIANVPLDDAQGGFCSTLLSLRSALLIHRHTGMTAVVAESCQEDVGALLEMLIDWSDDEDEEPAPLTTYRVVAKEVCEVDYEVAATDPEDACRRVLAGEGKRVMDTAPTPVGWPMGPGNGHSWEVVEDYPDGPTRWVDLLPSEDK